MFFKIIFLQLILCFMMSAHIMAEDSKLIKVDLDVDSTVIVFAETDVKYYSYYIDKTACICTAQSIWGNGSGLTTVPCKKLGRHPKLKKHVKHCQD